VTLRSSFRPLRSQHVFPALVLAISRSNRRDGARFRVLHFSVQYDHIHLIVEAADQDALSTGVRSLAIGMALAINRLVMRRGRLWADRWFGRALTSPRQVRHALVYVLANFRKHARREHPPGVDRFSSGSWFDGWRGALPRDSAGGVARPVSSPRTWLAGIGWRRLGLIGFSEMPATDGLLLS